MFGTDQVAGGSLRVDAQTLTGVPDASQDFVIEAHVIEHLFDPVGAIHAASRVLKGRGMLVLVVPNMRHTFDHLRPETSLEHVLRDFADGGEGTRRQAYEEHVRYVHPVFCEPVEEADVKQSVSSILDSRMDVHVHAWTPEGFRALLDAVAADAALSLEAQLSVANETIYALRKLERPLSESY